MNVLITYPSLGELNRKIDINIDDFKLSPNGELSDDGQQKIWMLMQTWKCICVLAGINEVKKSKLKITNKPIIVDKIIVVIDAKQKSNPVFNENEALNNLKEMTKLIYKEIANEDVKPVAEIIQVDSISNFEENFELLNNEISNNRNDTYYINAASGVKDSKKFLYPIGLFNENARVIESNNRPKENKSPDSNDKFNYVNYEEKFLNASTMSEFNSTYEEFINKSREQIDENGAETINPKEFTSLEDVRKLALNRSTIENRENIGSYKQFNKLNELKAAISKYNYVYLYTELQKQIIDDPAIEALIKKLYLGSLNAYDKNDQYSAYLCFAVLVAQGKSILAFNEIENVLPKYFYKHEDRFINRYKINSMGSLLNDPNNPNSIYNRIIQKANLTDDIFGDYKLDEYKLNVKTKYIKHGKNKKLVIYDTNGNGSNIVDFTKDKLKGITNPYERFVKFLRRLGSKKINNENITCYESKNEVINKLIIKINLVELYRLIYLNGKNKLEDNYPCRNYYLNILNDLGSEYTEVLRNSNLVTYKEIKKGIPNRDIDDIIVDEIANAKLEKVEEAFTRLEGLLKKVDFLRAVRNQYVHAKQNQNIYIMLKDDQINEYLELKTAETSDNNIKNEIAARKDNHYFDVNDYGLEVLDDFVNGNIPINQYNEELIEYLENSYSSFNIDDVEVVNNSSSKALVSIFTDKLPYLSGVYAPAISILLREKLVNDSNIDTIYFLVTNEFIENDVFNKAKVISINKEIDKIYPGIKIHYYSLNNSKSSEIDINDIKIINKNPMKYDIDVCFKALADFYNIISPKHNSIVIDETSGSAQLSTAISLLKLISTKIEIANCRNNESYYYDKIKANNEKEKVSADRRVVKANTLEESSSAFGTQSRPFVNLINNKQAYSFVNIIEAQRKALEGFDFNFLYFNKNITSIASQTSKKAIDKLYSWSNGNSEDFNATDATVAVYVNNLIYMMLMNNGSKINTAILSSGIVIEGLVRTMLTKFEIINGGTKKIDIDINEYNKTYDQIVRDNIDLINEAELKTYANLEFVYPDLATKKKVDLLQKNIWLPILYDKLSNNNFVIGKNELVNMHNLFEARNTLIHKLTSNSAINSAEEEEKAKKTLDSGIRTMVKYVKNKYRDIYDNIMGKYRENILIIADAFENRATVLDKLKEIDEDFQWDKIK